jgi:hypothetical protein
VPRASSTDGAAPDAYGCTETLKHRRRGAEEIATQCAPIYPFQPLARPQELRLRERPVETNLWMLEGFAKPKHSSEAYFGEL